MIRFFIFPIIVFIIIGRFVFLVAYKAMGIKIGFLMVVTCGVITIVIASIICLIGRQCIELFTGKKQQ